MFGHYLIFALRKFTRTPVTAALNILGLALGLACFLGAYGIANYWSLSDSYFANSDRTYVVTGKYELEGTRTPYFPITPSQVGLYLREDFPQLEVVARAQSTGEWTAAVEDRKFALFGAAAEAEFLQVFDFEFIEGGPSTALNASDKIILTESAAQKLFGDEAALGRSLRLSNEFSPTVGGVIKAIKTPTHMSALGDGALNFLRFDFLSTWSAERNDSPNWFNTSTVTYVLFPENDRSITPDSLADQLDAFVERRMPERQRQAGSQVSFNLISLGDFIALYLSATLLGEASDVLSVTTLLSLLGLMVLAVACVNYANLASAQAAGRGKEIGMRKILGAGRLQMFIQYWSEALIFAALAAVLALLLFWIMSPVFASSASETLIDPSAGLFSGAEPLLIVTGVVIAVSLVACLYPVLILAGVRPVEALRAGSVRAGPKFIMQFLVGVQFAIASLFLIVLTVMTQQMSHLRNDGLQQTAPVVILQDDASRAIGYEALAADLADEPGIVAVTQLNYTPYLGGGGVSVYSSDPEGLTSNANVNQNFVGYDFFSVFDATILAGRVFDRERNDHPGSELWTQFWNGESPDGGFGRPLPVVIDRGLSDAMGFASPDDAVGRMLYLAASMRNFSEGGPRNPQFEIIGVVESMPLYFVSQVGGALNIYFLPPPDPEMAGSGRPIIQLSGADMPAALQAIRDAVEARDPYALVKMQFLDESFQTGVDGFGTIQTVVSGLSLLAFAIAFLGLFAMAAYVAGRRRREIGIRKTLGASTANVVGLLLRDFSTPVLIGNLIAWPLAYLGASGYLSIFTDRIGLTPLPWLIGLALTIAIAWLAVGGQAWRAASVNPADVLRNE